jgi:hypothetical protein
MRAAACLETERGQGLTEVVMKPRILTWNVRGLNEEAKRLRVKNLLRLWKVDIVSSRD